VISRVLTDRSFTSGMEICFTYSPPRPDELVTPPCGKCHWNVKTDRSATSRYVEILFLFQPLLQIQKRRITSVSMDKNVQGNFRNCLCCSWSNPDVYPLYTKILSHSSLYLIFLSHHFPSYHHSIPPRVTLLQIKTVPSTSYSVPPSPLLLSPPI
jgi:hypothetical protein